METRGGGGGGYHGGYSERKCYGLVSKKGGGILSTKSENDSLREIRTLPNHVAGRGGDVSQCEAYGRDGNVWPGYERGFTPVILASRDVGECRGERGGGGADSPDRGDSGGGGGIPWRILFERKC